MRAMILALAMTVPFAASAQAPAAGSGGGGPVAPSVPSPNMPHGVAPPGTPRTGADVGRNAAGQGVIGHTQTPGSAVAGSTTGQDSGVKK